MPQHRLPRVAHLALLAAATMLLALATVLAPAPAAAGSAATAAARTSDEWTWPLSDAAMVRPYQAPAHEYGPGHRGVDVHSATTRRVRAPRGGVVAFVGRIADRGILTIDHGDGYVTTLEPIASSLVAGTRVERGEIVGTRATGGHAAPGTLHFGVRWHGEYINPLLLFGGVPRAVLLPCCS